ncbi:MAG: type II toxin-antitoxin system RelE/ParE family toxin [Bryobacteraceae bacterium]
MSYAIVITPAALRMLSAISDRRIRAELSKRIDGLAREPEKQGQPLLAEFQGLRSLRAVGQRYRIIYRVDRGRVVVLVVAAGIRTEGSRQDVYELARKLIRLRLV